MRFANGREVLLQRLACGQRVTVLTLCAPRPVEQAVQEQQQEEALAVVSLLLSGAARQIGLLETSDKPPQDVPSAVTVRRHRGAGTNRGAGHGHGVPSARRHRDPSADPGGSSTRDTGFGSGKLGCNRSLAAGGVRCLILFFNGSRLRPR